VDNTSIAEICPLVVGLAAPMLQAASNSAAIMNAVMRAAQCLRWQIMWSERIKLFLLPNPIVAKRVVPRLIDGISKPYHRVRYCAN
jgi:hypothetical protein